MPRHERHVDVAGFADRFAVVDALQHAEETLALLYMPGQRVEQRGRARSPRSFAQAGCALRAAATAASTSPRRALADQSRDALAARGLEHVEQIVQLGEGAVDEMAEAAFLARFSQLRYCIVRLGRGAVVHAGENLVDRVHESRPSVQAMGWR